MGATFATMQSVLKEDYEGPLRDEINSLTTWLNRLEKSNENIIRSGGLRTYVPLRVARTLGLGARATSGATLPAAGNQTYLSATWDLAALYKRIDIEDYVMDQTSSDEYAFIKAFESEAEYAKADAACDLNRQLFGDGTGNLTACGTTSNSTTVTVTSTAKLEVGMLIDIVTTSTGVAITNGNEIEILTIPSSTTFTVSVAVTTSSSHNVCLHGNHNKEVIGINYAIDNADSATLGTYGGIDRDTYPIWKAQESGTAGTDTPLSGGRMQTLLDTIEQNKGKTTGNVSVILCDFATARTYANLGIPDVRYNISKGPLEKVDIGYTGLSYNGIEILRDKNCPANLMFFVNESTFQVRQTGDWHWMNKEGNIMSKVADRPAYEATLARYMQLICTAPNANGRLQGIEMS